MRNEKAKRFLPYLLSLLVIVVDQITKIWVIKTIPENSIGYSFFNDFLWIVHVRNNAVAFSLGTSIPVVLKYILFVVLPLALMGALIYIIGTSRFDNEISWGEKWCLAGILGGGIGNLIDRIFRSLRVVDWISVKFYGLFGMDRFPTWNIGDASVVVSVIMLIILLIIDDSKKRKLEAK